MQRADFDAAITELEAALKLAPENASLHYNLGLAYKLKDQLDKAVPEFQNAIRLQPDLADAHYTLGVLYLAKRRIRQGDRRTAGGDSGSAQLCGSALHARDGFQAAGKTAGSRQRRLREAIRLQPDFAGAHTTLAAVLRQLGDAQGAAEEAKAGAKIAASTNNLQAATFSTNSGKRLLSCGGRGWGDCPIPLGHQLRAELRGRRIISSDWL